MATMDEALEQLPPEYEITRRVLKDIRDASANGTISNDVVSSALIAAVLDLERELLDLKDQISKS